MITFPWARRDANTDVVNTGTLLGLAEWIAHTKQWRQSNNNPVTCRKGPELDRYRTGSGTLWQIYWEPLQFSRLNTYTYSRKEYASRDTFTGKFLLRLEPGIPDMDMCDNGKRYIGHGYVISPAKHSKDTFLSHNVTNPVTYGHNFQYTGSAGFLIQGSV